MKIKDPLFNDVIIRRVVFKIEKKHATNPAEERSDQNSTIFMSTFYINKNHLGFIFNCGQNSTLQNPTFRNRSFLMHF